MYILHIVVEQFYNIWYEGPFVPGCTTPDALQQAVVPQVPAVALGVERRQQASVGWGSQHLPSQPQCQHLAPLTQRWELQSLKGTLVSASLLLPASLLPS